MHFRHYCIDRQGVRVCTAETQSRRRVPKSSLLLFLCGVSEGIINTFRYQVSPPELIEDEESWPEIHKAQKLPLSPLMKKGSGRGGRGG